MNCSLGETCFVQQTPDLASGSEILDSFCGEATYDGHTGWDIRVRTPDDVAQGVEVVSVADGLVLRSRDGIEDRLVETAAEREAVKQIACGNGIVVQQEHEIEAQYCHLRRGSLRVRPGDKVEKGQVLGQIGYSGNAAFPHVHLTIRRGGEIVDPLTGSAVPSLGNTSCRQAAGLFDESATSALRRSPTVILDIGLSPGPPVLKDIASGEKTRTIDAGSSSLFGWLWAINLPIGTRVELTIRAPSGDVMEHTTEALIGRKAQYLAYAGKKMDVVTGDYTLDASLVLADGTRQRMTRRIFIK